MNNIVIYETPDCPYCGKSSEVEVEEGPLRAWQRGKFIQDAFPDKTLDERELLMTGFHASCWALAFPDEE